MDGLISKKLELSELGLLKAMLRQFQMVVEGAASLAAKHKSPGCPSILT